MPVSPAREIINEAGEYKFPEANHQKASTHEITNKAESGYNFRLLTLEELQKRLCRVKISSELRNP